MNEVFQYANWAEYLSLNVSNDLIVENSVLHYFEPGTNEICIEFDYRQPLEDMIVRTTLDFPLATRRLLSPDPRLLASTAGSASPSIQA